jgi:hypothetical protein
MDENNKLDNLTARICTVNDSESVLFNYKTYESRNIYPNHNEVHT